MQIDTSLTTLERIHQAAKREFLEKGYKGASLRNIVRSLSMTTGAFYGYYKSKEQLFEALVGEHYDHMLTCFKKAQQSFAKLPHEQQPEVMSEISGACMFEMLHYAYAHLEEYKLILCLSLIHISNMLAFGQRIIGSEMAKEIVNVWLGTPFSNGERHIQRIRKVMAIEEE